MNILITSAGRRSYIIDYFKDALKSKGLVFACNSEYSIALQHSDGYFISPLIYQENYVDSIINFCVDNKIQTVISVFDIDLMVLSKYSDRFHSSGINLIISSYDSIKICNDKWLTYNFLKKNNIDTPKTYVDLLNLKEDIRRNKINYPIIIKPRWGMASLSLYIAENEEELDVLSKKSKREILKSYLKFESNLTPEQTLVYQEKLNGQEYGLDVINDLDENYICVLPKSKIRMRAGETDLGQTVNPDKFEFVSKKLSQLLKHKAILSVDCFDCDGVIKVLEMNCRISGHYPLSHLAGVNLPKQIVDWIEGKPTNKEYFNFNKGLYITKDLKPVVLKKE